MADSPLNKEAIAIAGMVPLQIVTQNEPCEEIFTLSYGFPMKKRKMEC